MLFLRIAMCSVYIKSVGQAGGEDNDCVRLFNILFRIFTSTGESRKCVSCGCK